MPPQLHCLAPAGHLFRDQLGGASVAACSLPTDSCSRAARPFPLGIRPTEARTEGSRGVGRRKALKALGLSALALGSGIGPRASALPKADVLVLGAGVAGLAAARRIAASGARPLVLEARGRPGGRTYTRFDLPDRAEFGAVEIGDSYTRTHALAQACGLRIAPLAGGRSTGLTLHVNGQTLASGDWPNSSANPLAGTERQVLPSRLEAHYLASDIPLTQAAAWDLPTMRPHDRSIATELRARGASEEALKLVNVTGNHNHSDAVSVLPWWRSALLFRQATGVGTFVQGCASLAKCLAAQLGETVRYGSVVTRIATDRGQLKVTLADGTEFRARRCICTLPLPALRNVRLELPLDATQRRVIAQADYTQATVAMFDADPFWKEDGLAPAMWTDSPLERLFPRRHPETGECIGFKAFVNGAGAKALDDLDEAAFAKLALATVARIRPSSNGRVRYLARHSWGADPFAGGAYAAWPPGQVAEWRAAVRRPAGPVRFAGEHTANAPGVEGAIRSGEEAAATVLDSLREAAS
ncbi:MAG: FAD-dependent oxidoreductase [Gammaproteobacteria bacterium]|nr:FAD-dependent oxidoreductase [Gammaproteobacteria bacterium]MYE51964.1 FAD-dependent oxidoreductase [Gammaproteobacteria bacterium]